MGGDGTLLHASSLFQVSIFFRVDFVGLMWNQEARLDERLKECQDVEIVGAEI